MLKYKIGTAGAVMLMLTIVVTHTLLSLPRDILVITGSATILNLIYITAIALCLAYLIYRMMHNFPGLDIIDISALLGGKVFQKIIGIIFISYFILSGGIMLRNFCEGLKVIYYPMTNIVFILLLLHWWPLSEPHLSELLPLCCSFPSLVCVWSDDLLW